MKRAGGRERGRQREMRGRRNRDEDAQMMSGEMKRTKDGRRLNRREAEEGRSTRSRSQIGLSNWNTFYC